MKRLARCLAFGIFITTTVFMFVPLVAVFVEPSILLRPGRLGSFLTFVLMPYAAALALFVLSRRES